MKALSEIDTIYGSLYKKMSIRERISYCELLIKTINSSEGKEKSSIYSNNEERMKDILIAAKEELKILRNNDDRV